MIEINNSKTCIVHYNFCFLGNLYNCAKNFLNKIKENRKNRPPVEREDFYVVHPLDDVKEDKIDVEALGPMHLTLGSKIALLALRLYLIFMGLLVVYHAWDLFHR